MSGRTRISEHVRDRKLLRSKELGLAWASSNRRLALAAVIDKAGEAVIDPDRCADCLARRRGKVARRRPQNGGCAGKCAPFIQEAPERHPMVHESPAVR
eukprot:2702215-Pyramimonas_sp.AAC.1